MVFVLLFSWYLFVCHRCCSCGLEADYGFALGYFVCALYKVWFNDRHVSWQDTVVALSTSVSNKPIR